MAQKVPVSSATSGIEFSRLSSEDVRKLSVKRIHVTPSLDSMFGPMPGGVHDLALGAINVLDATCSTCRMASNNCPGHCGHIELPTQVYHAQYIDTTLRLLRAKCVYCHHFRVVPNRIHHTISQLRLLQHGLVKGFHDLTRYKLGSKRKKRGTEEEGESEEDIEGLMDRRSRFVNRSIKRARKDGDAVPLAQNPIAQQMRKDVIAGFLQEVALSKKCARCRGISPSYRKDRATKMFRMPLPTRAREEMRVLDKKAPNPLIYLISERKEKEPVEKQVVNGDKDVQ